MRKVQIIISTEGATHMERVLGQFPRLSELAKNPFPELNIVRDVLRGKAGVIGSPNGRASSRLEIDLLEFLQVMGGHLSHAQHARFIKALSHQVLIVDDLRLCGCVVRLSIDSEEEQNGCEMYH